MPLRVVSDQSLPQQQPQSTTALSMRRPTSSNQLKTTSYMVKSLDSAASSSSSLSNQVSLISPDKKDTLDSLLSFLKVSGSPVSGVMELRSLLMSQKEEKILLRSVVEQMRVELKGIK